MAIDFDSKNWGVYDWDENLSVADNVAAADNANALIKAADLQRFETAILALDAAIDNIELTPGPPGKDGADGVDGQRGTDGADGAPGTNGTDGEDGASVTAIELELDETDTLVSGTATLSDNTTIPISVTHAG